MDGEPDRAVLMGEQDVRLEQPSEPWEFLLGHIGRALGGTDLQHQLDILRIQVGEVARIAAIASSTTDGGTGSSARRR